MHHRVRSSESNIISLHQQLADALRADLHNYNLSVGKGEGLVER